LRSKCSIWYDYEKTNYFLKEGDRLEKVRAFIEKHQLLEKRSTVVVGVSGGPDSLALLHFFWTMKEQLDLTIIAAHVDHMFRGKQSEEDMHFVKHFCEKFGIICEAIQVNVQEHMNRFQLGAQEAARECRYRFFDQVMRKYNAHYLALAHHGDDQIETILMRLVRGSLPRGYAGIPIKRPFSTGYIIRPFLCIDREEIERYCRIYQLEPRRDPSNDKDDYTRNRFRHHVLPFLKKENIHVHEHFQRFSEMMSEDEAFLEELTIQAMNNVIKKQQDCVEIEIPPFLAMPKPLQRRGIQLILNYLYRNIPSSLSSVHINNALFFLNRQHPSGVLHFPNGLKLIRKYHIGLFTFDSNEKEVDAYNFEMNIPGTLHLPNGFVMISEFWGQYPKERHHHLFIVDPDLISLPLRVRTRKAGDRMEMKGMRGTKKISRIFIDEKVPLNERNLWPIVEDAQGRIIWLPGLKKSVYEATDVTKNRYIVLHYKKQ
jgi:tRNA(Ile)-lysidine synthase